MRAVNLIPVEQRSGGGSLAGRSGGAAFIVVGVICGLALIALLYGVAAHEVSSQQGEAERLSAEAAQAQAQAAKLAPYTRFVTMREERLKAVQQIANTRFDWAHAMHELGRVLPSDVALSTVTATVGAAAGATSSTSSSSASSTGAAGAASAGSSVASATPAGSTPTFTISGCTTSQSEVAVTMDRLRLIDGVSEVSLQSSAKGSSGGSGGSSSGACPGGDPVFTLQVTFDALPQPAVKTPPVEASPTASTSSAGGASARSGAEGAGR